MAINPDNRPQNKHPYLSAVPWRISISLAVLVVLTFLGLTLNNRGYLFSNDANPETDTAAQTAALSSSNETVNPDKLEPKAAALPDIVEAIEAGKAESLVVSGDQLLRHYHRWRQPERQEKSTISALETLRLLGVSDNALANLSITVEDPNPRPNPLNTWLITGALVLIGLMLFRAARSRQDRGTLGPTGIGKSNPRVMSNAAGKKDKENMVETPQVTFEDVAGAEQAKLELQEVIEFLKHPDKFIKLGAGTCRCADGWRSRYR